MDTLFIIIREEIMTFYHSTFFTVIKFLLGIYVLVLFIDLVLLLIKRGVGANIRNMKYGAEIPKELAVNKGKLAKKWIKIKDRLESGKEAQYKVAIIEADEVIDQLLQKMGYEGGNMGERLDKMSPGEIENRDEIKEAHETRNKIIHDHQFEVNEDLAKETIKKFENFINIFEI